MPDHILMPDSNEDLKFLTLNEAARILQVSKRTLFRMVQDKKIPALKVGGQWRIRESQFVKWIEGRENALERFD